MSAWQAGSTYAFTGLTAATSYGFRHEVRDAALNTKAGMTVTTSTPAAPVWSTVFTDNFTAVADGSAVASRTTETGALTYHASSTATITGEGIYNNVHAQTKTIVLPRASTTSVRFSGEYQVDTASGSNGAVAISVLTNGTYNNYINFTLTHASGFATVSFTDFASGVWTATIPTATGHAKAGTFELTYNPAGKSGSLKLGGVEVATFSGDTVVNPTGFYGTVASNFAALDTLKREVSSV